MDDFGASQWVEWRRIARDATRSSDERHEAVNRLNSSIEMYVGIRKAEVLGCIARLDRAYAPAADAMRGLGAALAALEESAMASLSPDLAAQVRHLVVNEDECVLDAIELVTAGR